MRRAALMLVITCSFIVSDAQVNPSDKMPIDPQVKIGKLDNGLTYYIRQNKRPEKKVELRLVVNVGSINEDDDQQGLAHMAEHMGFNGTTHFKKERYRFLSPGYRCWLRQRPECLHQLR